MAPLDRSRLEAEITAALSDGVAEDPRALLSWAHGLLGDGLMMSTAFGKSGMVILHMVRDIIPELPIYFLDTGFHFQETLDYADALRRDWKLNITFHRPELFGDAFRQRFGDDLYETNPDLCCHKNKVEPFAELIARHQGWIAGIRRDQSSSRADAEPIELLESNKLKVQPLVMWTRDDVERYIAEHSIPTHPLFEQGYQSIGCAPCTKPCAGAAQADERAGRWAGKEKTECGLHLFWASRESKPDAATNGTGGGPREARPTTEKTAPRPGAGPDKRGASRSGNPGRQRTSAGRGPERPDTGGRAAGEPA